MKGVAVSGFEGTTANGVGEQGDDNELRWVRRELYTSPTYLILSGLWDVRFSCIEVVIDEEIEIIKKFRGRFRRQSDSHCYLTFCLPSQFGEHLEIMGDAIDLTGDGGVIKTIVRRAKPDAIAPTDSLPLVDDTYAKAQGINYSHHMLHVRVQCSSEQWCQKLDLPRVKLGLRDSKKPMWRTLGKVVGVYQSFDGFDMLCCLINPRFSLPTPGGGSGCFEGSQQGHSENLVHYEGILPETGEVFDTTREDNTVFTFEVGKGNVIKGWDVALRTMKVNENCWGGCKADSEARICLRQCRFSSRYPPRVMFLLLSVCLKIATLVFEVELVACRPPKGSSLNSVSDEKARLQELKKQREIAAAVKEEEKKRREEAKAAAAARIQAKMESKKGQGKGKGKAK
ncbi:hypothetical protein RHSIM_Rhsim03G0135800 [Rhododendron simsii]|uniref:peptidylprolyl isomerase n=1 Tax=Rhododendron simsii TaxID=118357 RepID=A0A834HE73_RHOSS|nr:hypothetical protein RHSIM_Rhsim03G0135800 [Rhododendron simsii]